VKKYISLLLAFVMMFTIAIPCSSIDSQAALSGCEEVFDNDVIQKQFDRTDTQDRYQITATDTKYYKFTFLNQSVELRTGISIADNLINHFFGKINIQITDQYDLILSEFSVRCGYQGNVSLKFTKDSTYYIKVTSNLIGYYRMKVNSYADIGGDTWNNATETLSVGQLISSIDASGDKDWFYFDTDDTDSFYDFSLENISGSSTMYLELYEYVEGAGEIPLRDTKIDISASSSRTASKQLKLKPNTRYYMCVLLNSGIGGYQLDITQTLDAVGDKKDTAYEVQPDTKVTTAIDGKGDVDFFKFTTKNYEAYYYFNIDNLSINNDCYIYIYDDDSTQLKKNSAYKSDFSTNIKLSPNTEYFFKINSTSSGVGNYSFTITDVPDKFANEQSNAGEIKLDETVSESISGHGDADFYKFTTADYDAYYYVNVENLGITDDCFIYIYDTEENELKKNSAYKSNFSANIKLPPNTEYFFKICSTSWGVGNYKVTVTTEKDFYPNTLKEAKKINIDETVSESISGHGDADFYKFTTADYDAYYYVNVENLGITDDCFIYIYDTEENELKKNSAYKSNFSANIKLPPNTEYFFKICSTSWGVGNYKVTVTTEKDFYPNTLKEAKKINIDETVSESISGHGDNDFYKFTTADYDAYYYVNVENLGITDDCFIYIYDADGNQLKKNSAYKSNFSANIKLPPNTEYFFKINSTSIGVGNYKVTLTTKADPQGDTKDKAYEIGLNEQLTCELTSDNDVDWFKFSVNRDKNLRFVFTNETGNYKQFYVYSAIDKKLLESYCTESAEKTILLEAGDYYIKVYGKDGYYTLAVGECASGHVETSSYLEATLEDDGVKTTFCKYCQKVMGKEFVPRIDSVSLSYTTAVYNKKPQKPEVLVYDIDGTVIPSSQYDVKYSSEMIEVGTYSIEVIFKDKYAGTKTLEFEIKSVGSDGFYMCGDVDGNGVVNIKDATAIQKFIAGMTIPVFYESVADADENGSINVKDATAIQKWIASLLPDSNIGKYPNK